MAGVGDGRIVYTREDDRLLRFIRRNIYGVTDESLDQFELAKLVKGFNIRYFDSRPMPGWTNGTVGRERLPQRAILIELML